MEYFENLQATVLVVDDNKDGADSLALILRVKGFDAVARYCGATALAFAETHRPYCVVLDLEMPGMSGLDVARAIRRHSWGTGVLIVALSGWSRPGDFTAAEAAGFDHYLTKPLNDYNYNLLLGVIGSRRSKLAD